MFYYLHFCMNLPTSWHKRLVVLDFNFEISRASQLPKGGPSLHLVFTEHTQAKATSKAAPAAASGRSGELGAQGALENLLCIESIAMLDKHGYGPN